MLVRHRSVQDRSAGPKERHTTGEQLATS